MTERVEFIDIETEPWTYGVMGEAYPDAELVGLAQHYLDALDRVRREVDNVQCEGCPAPIGLVLHVNNGDTGPSDVVRWVPLVLASRLDVELSPAETPFVALFCADCVPYVPKRSHHE